jgi:hypothetical protein
MVFNYNLTKYINTKRQTSANRSKLEKNLEDSLINNRDSINNEYEEEIVRKMAPILNETKRLKKKINNNELQKFNSNLESNSQNNLENIDATILFNLIKKGYKFRSSRILMSKIGEFKGNSYEYDQILLFFVGINVKNDEQLEKISIIIQLISNDYLSNQNDELLFA